MKLLEINHVEKSFDNLTVLKDISLSVEDGEIVLLIVYTKNMFDDLPKEFYKKLKEAVDA